MQVDRVCKRNIAAQLTKTIGISTTSTTSEAYFNFLMDVLQVTSDSDSNPEVVYPLLRANQDKLDLGFAEVLQNWATANLPQRKAAVQNIAVNIGTFSLAMWQFRLGKRADNLEIALAGYRVTLIVFTPELFPENWAKTQNNLGIAYSERIKGDKADNLETAITCYRQALTIYTPEAFPKNWAMTQNNLGNAYADRIKGEKVDNLEIAIACFRQALTVHTPEALPVNYIETSSNLGLTYQAAKRFQDAENILTSAINAVDSLREEILSGNETTQKLAEEYNQIYLTMVEVCLVLDRVTNSIEYAERSKTRNLVEQILTRDLKTIFRPEVVTQLEKLRDEIANGQYELQTATADNPTALAQHLQQLRQKRNKLQDEYLAIGSSFNLNKCLTLDAIFSLNLEKCRLVTLSACETGLIDFTNNSDEYIGLISGFLIAGSPAVVSSLWTVSDLSTAFLMIKFYENLQTQPSIALALNHAQQWLRNLTCQEFEAALKQLQPQIDQILAQLKPGKRFVLEEAIEEDLKEIRDRKPYPFANPFYWAAFTASGI